jgi:hypothetical protein
MSLIQIHGGRCGGLYHVPIAPQQKNGPFLPPLAIVAQLDNIGEKWSASALWNSGFSFLIDVGFWLDWALRHLRRD